LWHYCQAVLHDAPCAIPQLLLIPCCSVSIFHVAQCSVSHVKIACCGHLSAGAGSRQGCKPVSLRNPPLVEQFKSGIHPFELMGAQVAERDRLARLSAAAHVNAHAELADLPVQTRASRTGNNLHYAHNCNSPYAYRLLMSNHCKT